MLSERFVPYEMKTSILRISSYDQKNPVGWLENPYWKGSRPFSNLTQMLFFIEERMDALDYPQRDTAPRALAQKLEHPAEPGQAEEPVTERCLASFRLSILFRQNASWQGSVQWLEQNVVSQFRSALELVQLLDSVLEQYEGSAK
jgi:hypothetical protein